MQEFPPPTVVVSRCLGFEACRYDGQILQTELVNRLQEYVKIIPVCPEMEIGLGVPREALRLVDDTRIRLIQPATNRDFTGDMEAFSRQFLENLDRVDGFILQNRSPSCGVDDCKLYLPGRDSPTGKISGLFTGMVRDKYPSRALEDPGRLTNFYIREHFLTRIFTSARFRRVKQDQSINSLVNFQSRHKFLLQAQNEKIMREMGRLATNNRQRPVEKVIRDYETLLYQALSQRVKYTANINVMMHIMGFFSEELSGEEKKFFLGTLEKYRREKVSASVPLTILRSWIIKYDNVYLKGQAYFNPFPGDLVDLEDSGRGRRLENT